jgi:flavin-dependent dehydrogenase
MVVFPWIKENEINAIFLTLDPYLSLDEASDYFMNKHPIYSKWFKDSEKLRTFTSLESIYSPIREPFGNNVLIVGDAGGTQEVENTGAMISGWKAGNAVATAVIENRVGIETKGISHYLRWWKETYIDTYSHEDYVKNFTFPYLLSGDDLNYLFGLIEEPLAPCFNPYEALDLIGQAIQQKTPTIQQERPDVIPKLAKMAAPLKELLNSIRK